ncbi:MAG: response regulator [Candidatus Cohnella colombiensis]|uniref:Circadian input-output histidine kinase CikA n=1 Tax=Candidatus Cohnella colombiensis TaxID=3121368 RepID=A0AA95EYS6_9BACL|nr:MAG: response regulator [Cohnella sp.]
MHRSLRFKVIILFVIANILSFIALNFINYEVSNKQISKQLKQITLNELRTASSNLGTVLSLEMNKAIIYSHSDKLLSGTLEQKLIYLHEEIKNSSNSYVYDGIAELNGRAILSNGNVLWLNGETAFVKAINGTPSFTNPIVDDQGNHIISVMVPQFDPSKQVRQILIISLNANEIFNKHLKMYSEDGQMDSILLLDRNMNLLHTTAQAAFNADDNLLALDPSFQNLAIQLKTTQEGFSQAKINNVGQQIFYVKVPALDWYAVYIIPANQYNAPLLNSIWKNIGFIALAQIVLGVVLFLITQVMILRRLKRIVNVTQQVASGDFYTPPLPIRSMDEIGSLSSSINLMSEKLRDLFEPFETFIHHNRFAMIVTNASYHITSFNSLAEEMLGYSEKEVIGRRAMMLWFDQAQLEERARAYSKKLKKTVSADEVAIFALSLEDLLPDYEWNWVTRPGSKILVSINPSIMRNSDGSIKGYVIIARDISDIKEAVQSNTRLLEIMDRAHDLVASFDLHGRMFYLNQEGLTFLGIEELNDVNKQLGSYLTIPNALKFAEGLNEAQQHGHWQSELEFVSVSGATRITSITVVAHHTDTDNHPYYSTIVRDISEQKEIEHQLIAAKEEADAANDAKGSFLARMSHEIRTPLNGIIGLTYLLQRSELTEIQHDYLKQITTSSQNLLHILNDILDFSKLEADQLKLAEVPFCLEDSVYRLSGIFSVLLGHKPIDFIIELDPTLPHNILGDPLRLEQVLLNLSNNAIKYTNEGIIHLKIYELNRTDDQIHLHFSVKDTGIGITPEQQQQLFTPFFQADDKPNRRYGGTGLGLVISQTLIEKMGGYIRLESIHHVGSTFSFELTFKLPKQLELIKTTVIPFKVLVQEDQLSIGEYWLTALQSIGCTPVVVPSWQSALPLLQEGHWDAMIIDMEASDMHGEDTWSDWKEQLDRLNIKTISLTTLLGRDALQHVSPSLMPAAVIVKPVTITQLTQVMQQVKDLIDYYQTPQLKQSEPLLNQADIRRIMVVDDQEINRLVAKDLLEQKGFEVAVAKGGQEALQLIEQALPDLVLMDLHMPDIDGIETTIQLRKHYNAIELPIVALTADVTSERQKQCLQAGMNDIITKPIQPELLFSVLTRLLRIPQLPNGPTVTVVAEQLQDVPGLVIQQALDRLDNKSKLYLQLLHKFKHQYTHASEQISSFMINDQVQDATRLAHSLSGASGHIGAIHIQHYASELEQALRSGSPWKPLLTQLNEATQEVMSSIDSLIEQKSY